MNGLSSIDQMPGQSNSLDLPGAPAILFFFGLSGSGKSYVGDVIGRYAGWEVYHADDDITPAMRSALAQAQPFTDEMRTAYFSALKGKILERRRQAPRLVVTQGAYKRRHRNFLLEHVPDMEFVWVTAPDSLIAQRIARRSGGIALQSAAALKADFEQPPAGTKVVRNDGGDHEIIRQLNRLFGTGPTSA